MANVNPLAEGAGKTADPDTTIVLGSRNSQLALVQASQVSQTLTGMYGEEKAGDQAESSATAATRSDLGIHKATTFPITSMSTAGDQNLKSPLYVIGGEGKAIWTKELEVALKVGGLDALVHCLKDVPTTLPEEFMLGAVLEREDPRDALCIKAGLPYKTLDELPPGSVIGTSSVRRVAQLRRRYPSLVFSDVRGNLNTRLSKLDSPTGPYTAIVLAAAGLIRIKQDHRITAFLSNPVMLYSVGQGSLAIEVRKPPPGADPQSNRDARILEIVRSIGDWRATARAECERALLRELEGGCSIPVGVESKFEDHEEVEGKKNEFVDVAEEQEGHAITSNAVRAVAEATGAPISDSVASSASQGTQQNTAPSRPSMLSRLATGVQQPPSTNDQSISSTNGAEPAGESRDSGAASPSSSPNPPALPLNLTLKAIVVSLDGSRDCQYSLTRKIQHLEQARDLGVAVAKELRDSRGAKAILEEVERHRQIAEEMDRKRREQRKAQKADNLLQLSLKRKAGESDEPSEAQSSTDGADSAETPRSKEQEDQEVVRRLNELVPQAKSGEMDRRGIPREDGQDKVWEV